MRLKGLYIICYLVCCLSAGLGASKQELESTEFCEYSVKIPKGDLDCPVARLSRQGQPSLRDINHVTDIAKLKNSNLTFEGLLKGLISQLKDDKYSNIKRQLRHLLPVTPQCRSKVMHAGDANGTECKESPPTAYLRDCFEILKHGHFGTGVYYIKPDLASYPLPVYCDMDTTTGGWLVVTRRVDGSVNFTRNWNEYKRGFGNVDKEFWFGNDNMFLLTHQKNYSLRIDLELFNGKKIYYEYKNISIGAEIDNYRLRVSGFSGSYTYDLLGAFHNNRIFQTYDKGECSKHKGVYLAGWWFKIPCSYRMVLTGYASTSVSKGGVLGHSGKTWLRYRKAEMKIRPYM